jgi:hypothetical protein
MIKVEDVGDVLTEANVKAAEAILLFCQVQQKVFKINMFFLAFRVYTVYSFLVLKCVLIGIAL